MYYFLVISLCTFSFTSYVHYFIVVLYHEFTVDIDWFFDSWVLLLPHMSDVWYTLHFPLASCPFVFEKSYMKCS